MAEPIDDFAQRIMERTRERREMLAKKMADTSPRRKRSSPRSSSQLANITNTPRDLTDDSPNKRTCVRNVELSVHDDTPAVRGVKSRMTALAETRRQWLGTGDEDAENMDTGAAAPPPHLDFDACDGDSAPSPRPDRKVRLAALAQNINNWEDDLSHPTIRQEEPKKKVWQRPAPRPEDEPENTAPPARGRPARQPEPALEPAPAKPPRTYEHEAVAAAPRSPSRGRARQDKFVSPSRKPLEDALSPPKSAHAPARSSPRKAVSSLTVTLNSTGSVTSVSGATPAATVRQPSPYRSGSASTIREPSPGRSATAVREPSPYRNSSSRLREPSPARGLTTSPGRSTSTVRAPSPGSGSSTVRAPSPARNAILGNSVPRPYGSPAKLVTSSTNIDTARAEPVAPPVAQHSEPTASSRSSRRSDVHEPTKKPVADRLQAWRQRDGTAARPGWQQKSAVERLAGQRMTAVMEQSMLHDDDPLNMSIHSRMNVWETKIHQTEAEKEEAARAEQEIQMARHTPRHQSGGKANNAAPQRSARPVSPVRTHNTVTSKSPTRTQPAVTSKSPTRSQPAVTNKSPTHTSPSKVGVATKAVQERLNAFANNWQSNEIAEKIRQQKERDMEVLQNRWRTGVNADSEGKQESKEPGPSQTPHIRTQVSGDSVPSAPPPPSVRAPSPKPASRHREQHRDAMRKVLPNGGGDQYRTTLPAPNNFEEKLAQMGFAVESDTDHKHKATCDLTPYRERDRAARERQAREPEPEEVPKQPSTPGKPALVRMEETRVTEVKFEEGQRDSVVKRPIVTFTPGKPSTAYAQHNAAGKTPSIYSLIKKTGGPTAYKPPPTPTQAHSPRPAINRKDSFSDDSFESSGTQETEEEEAPPLPVKRQVHFSGAYGGSQSSLTSTISDSTQNSDTQNESYSEVTNTEDYSSEEDEETEESEDEEGNVSELLDEALDDTTTAQQPEKPLSPQPVPRRSKYSNPAARPPRPTTLPPQDSDVESTASSDYYNTRATRCSAPGGAPKRVKFRHDQSSSQSSHSESEHEAPAYSIDMYRNSRSKVNAPVPKMTIVRHSNSHQMQMEKQDPLPYTPTKSAKDRITELQERVNQEQSVIMQTSNALNQCCGINSTFAGSQEAVECHKLLLIACKKREAYISEMHRLRQGREEPQVGPRGSLTVTDIRLPLKQNFMHNIGGPTDLAMHFFLLLVRRGDHVVFTQMVGTHDAMVKGSLEFPNMIKFSDISQDFRLELEVYGMSVTREDPSAKSSKKKKGLTPKKLLKGGSRGFLNSPGGPSAVRSTNFVLVGHTLLDSRALNKTHFALDGVPFSSPLHGTLHLRLQCLIENKVNERGFLTIFEDVSGFGAWHRRWFVLRDTRLAYWKYPDDEKFKEPMGFLEMKQVVTDSIGLIPRDICARPNTFELITVRRQTRGEHDTLTSRCYNTMTTTKHWLSADTKEERMHWCNRLNEALVNIRTWHSDALRPIKQKDMVTPYNPYPARQDQRSCIIPFNPHDQQSAV